MIRRYSSLLRLAALPTLGLVMLALVFDSLGATYSGFAVCMYVLVFGYISWNDYQHRQIPNAISYPCILLGFICGSIILDNGFLSSFIGASIGFTFFFPIWIIPRFTLGAGDVKLSIAIGALCGFPKAILAFSISLAFLVPAVISILIIRSVMVNRGIPMSPFLSAGGLVGLLWGDDIVLWYTALLNHR